MIPGRGRDGQIINRSLTDNEDDQKHRIVVSFERSLGRNCSFDWFWAMQASRKRRRWLIATVVAGSLLVVAWWLMKPQIDQRFVGRWRMYSGNTSDQPDVPPDAESVFTFHSDGTGTVEVPRPGSQRRIDWWIEEAGYLKWKPEEDAVSTFRRLAFRFRRRFILKQGTWRGWQFVSFSDNRIVCRNESVFVILERLTD